MGKLFQITHIRAPATTNQYSVLHLQSYVEFQQHTIKTQSRRSPTPIGLTCSWVLLSANHSLPQQLRVFLWTR